MSATAGPDPLPRLLSLDDTCAILGVRRDLLFTEVLPDLPTVRTKGLRPPSGNPRYPLAHRRFQVQTHRTHTHRAVRRRWCVARRAAAVRPACRSMDAKVDEKSGLAPWSGTVTAGQPARLGERGCPVGHER